MRLCHILLLFLLFYQTVSGQENRPVLFTHLTTKDGLSENSVTCILKDRYGFLWFGTGDGLNKYDGYKFRVFRNNSGDPKTLPSNNITTLYEDKSGELWVGTPGWGIAKYNRNDDSFTSYGGGAIHSICESSDSTIWLGTFHGIMTVDRKTGKAVPAKLKNPLFQTIAGVPTSKVYKDSHKNIWIANSQGVFLLDQSSDKVRRVFYDNNISGDTRHLITGIAEGSNGIFWVGTGKGLYACSYLNDTLIRQRHDVTIPDDLSKAFITSICINKDQTLWVGKINELSVFDPANGTCRNFSRNHQNEYSLNHNLVWSLYMDDQGILWAGTSGGGINKYDKNQLPFDGYRLFDSEYPALIPNIVTSFEETPSGDIWIGTDGGGAFLWNASAGRFTSFHPEARKNFFPSYFVSTLRLSRDKERLWLGTNDQGVIELDIHTKAIRSFNTQNGMLESNSVTAILEDKNGGLWISTNGGGVSVINDVKGKAKHYSILSNTAVRTLFEDDDGSIWMGAYFGVKIYNLITKSFTDFTPHNSDISGIVNQIFRDSRGNIWLATPEKGLQLFNRKNKSFTTFSEEQGLAGNTVKSIVEDTRGFLWMGTSRGISCFDPRKHIFRNYSGKDGLLNSKFKESAGYITKAGMVLLGSIDGFNAFYPEDDKINTNIPPVAITDFQLLGKSLPAGIYTSQAKQDKNSFPEIKLSYDQSVFSIEFAALSFTAPEKNQYAYMLEGFDKNWNYTGYEHKATYMNLDPGTYIFRAIASNNDGIWNREGTALKIVIAPPFWKTKIAYMLYLAAVAIMLYYLYREIKARERLKNEIIFQKLTAGKIEELNQMKLNFFTNISHELRTPLSLIIDPLRKITHEKLSPEQAGSLSNLAYKNATRLSNLVSQLLDFRRTGAGQKLNPQHINIVDTVKEICGAFEEKTRERKIQFEISFTTAFTQLWMDVDKLEKILVNLISNAFKFTPDGGRIQVMVSSIIETDEKKALEIRVKDTGPGIPEAYKQKIFDLFFQVEGTPRYDMESSGIGLSLVKELVLLHEGKIMETGKEGEGALFEVKLPVREYKPVTLENEAAAEIPAVNISEESSDVSGNLPETLTILLVEDNTELREYIAEEVLSGYQVEQASSGTEGFEKAVMLIPDLIISDIMMANGNGLELCGKLKADEKTSHIPVILLTAKQTDEHKIEGYRSGADAYVSKPFNSTLLITQVENLLESRKKLRMLFSGIETLHAPEAEVMDIDREFLKKAEQVILDNLSNGQFDVGHLSSHLKMNRRQLSRKLQAIINYTPQSYIAIVRLRRGAELLAAGDLNISEVAYKVGFSEPANFTRAFTKLYGKNPSKYVSEIISREK
jgi:signal transduction histidine kinase/ligand-binding sensor domain-containing protein/DNA-binding response OmpR family regulator